MSKPGNSQAGSKTGRVKVVQCKRTSTKVIDDSEPTPLMENVEVKPINGKDKPPITKVFPDAGGRPTGRVAPQKKPTYPTVANLKKLHIAITSILVDSVEKTDLDEETQKAEKAYGLQKFNQPIERSFRPDMVSSGSEEVEEVVEKVEGVDTIEVADKVNILCKTLFSKYR